MSRKAAREMAVKLLYARDMGGEGDSRTVAALTDDEAKLSPADIEFANALADGAIKRKEELDEVVQANTNDWRLHSVALVDLCILRIAAYEMLFDRSSAHTVYIYEAVELAKTFGGEKSGAFVNGVLGGILKNMQGTAEERIL